MFDHGVFGAIEKNKYKKIDQIFWKITSKKTLMFRLYRKINTFSKQ